MRQKETECVCVCACECVIQRELERGREREGNVACAAGGFLVEFHVAILLSGKGENICP